MVTHLTATDLRQQCCTFDLNQSPEVVYSIGNCVLPVVREVELRRLRFDLTFTYKLVFGLIDLNLSDFFRLRSDDRNRGHQYKLFLPGCSSSARHNFFTYHAAKKCEMTYQLIVLTFPVLTVLNVVSRQTF